jgi:hypothetical protein
VTRSRRHPPTHPAHLARSHFITKWHQFSGAALCSVAQNALRGTPAGSTALQLVHRSSARCLQEPTARLVPDCSSNSQSGLGSGSLFRSGCQCASSSTDSWCCQNALCGHTEQDDRLQLSALRSMLAAGALTTARTLNLGLEPRLSLRSGCHATAAPDTPAAQPE